MDTDEAVRRLLAVHGGVATRRELVAVVGKRRLRRLVVAGTVVRIGRGRYALPDLDDEELVLELASRLVDYITALEPPRRG